jgi:hypothetical protein
MIKKVCAAFAAIIILLFSTAIGQEAVKVGDEALGTRKYEDFQKPTVCGTACHVDIYQQWTQAMMSQAYTHHWDEIEYFQLAVPHAGCQGTVRVFVVLLNHPAAIFPNIETK